MTGRGVESGGPADGERRSVVYCLIPAELAPKLHDLLRRHFRDEPGVEVVVERREGERRAGADRRQPGGKAPSAGERRRVRSTAGRRAGERRAAVAAVEPPGLPRRARGYADRLSFVERLEPADDDAEDRDTARLVARFQAGDKEAFATLYVRYFERVFAYLRVLLHNRHEAEDATQQVFTQLFENLSDYERRRQPFRAWLFTVVRNRGISELKRQGRLDLLEPERLNEHAEQQAAPEPLPMLGWLADRDLNLFVERLPLPQRQVLVLRYLLGLTTAEIARVLDRSEGDVRKLHSRALAFLRERLDSAGREPKTRRDRTIVRSTNKSLVLRARRFSLARW